MPQTCKISRYQHPKCKYVITITGTTVISTDYKTYGTRDNKDITKVTLIQATPVSEQQVIWLAGKLFFSNVLVTVLYSK